MQITIVGAGSIGLLLAARFSLAGHAVLLVTRTAEQAQLVNARGLAFTDAGGTAALARVRAASFAAPGAAGPSGPAAPDWLFLTVKQKDLHHREFLAQLRGFAGPSTRLLCFQNGVGHMEALAAVFPPHLLYAAVTTEGARRTSPCAVTHTGRGLTEIGRLDAAPAGMPEKKLPEAFAEAGFTARLSNEMVSVIYQKLLINAVINPLTAIARITNGELPAREASLSLMRDLFEEGIQVMSAEGISLPAGLWERILEVCNKTAANRSSMLQDLEAGRTTEIDWINGSLIQLAQRHGIQLQVHKTVCRMVKTIESQTSGGS
ncbi:ketopantoate reductase family protein [Paenibacillus gansuensis]|uniref:2-dehydropantoate 2-reductase n=1 Tax=Paenibacillus gansuensis TaxID=306542 RepID=A0ABW5PC74_9BACL